MLHPKYTSPRYWYNKRQPTQFTMRGLWWEVNKFFSSTSIHGFPYISDTQSRSTRIIWTLIVLAGFGVTSYFLYNTVDGFSEKYVTTTIEKRNIQKYPFPAVTFHPGEYNSKKTFLREFLNQFEFTRYEENSPLSDNEKFNQLYKWLTLPMNDKIFDDIEQFLILDEEKVHYLLNKGKIVRVTYLHYKAEYFREEVCQVLALYNNNVSLKSEIRGIFSENMYKYRQIYQVNKLIRIK